MTLQFGAVIGAYNVHTLRRLRDPIFAGNALLILYRCRDAVSSGRPARFRWNQNKQAFLASNSVGKEESGEAAAKICFRAGRHFAFLTLFLFFFFLSRACLLRKRAPVEEVDRWCESVCLLLLAKAKLPIILLPPSTSGPLVSVAVRPLES